MSAPCTQCADAGHYAWHDSLNDRETQVVCLCDAGTALLRKLAIARIKQFGSLGLGTPLAAIATCRVVESELARDGLIELVEPGDVWRLTEKGRAL